MLKLKQINKEYKTGELVQHALNNVSLNLRDNEFVAILGPSGSGKTTLLNIIGGLDRYDSGDLVINGISTKKYTDRDWDSYRNHTIGFVFQSYNLIPHQTVLGNVELALTISGVFQGRAPPPCRRYAGAGGAGQPAAQAPRRDVRRQMQRVGIARRTGDNPEPSCWPMSHRRTGQRDQHSGHGAVKRSGAGPSGGHGHPQPGAGRALRHPHRKAEGRRDPLRHHALRTRGRGCCRCPRAPEHGALLHVPAHLPFPQFQQSAHQKARTLLTAFAGSIGIIGIALILSLSNGVSRYISNMEKSTLAAYPLQISSTGVDLASMMDPDTYTSVSSGSSSAPEGMVTVRQLLSQLNIGAASNDLRSLKAYLDSDACTIGTTPRWNTPTPLIR